MSRRFFEPADGELLIGDGCSSPMCSKEPLKDRKVRRLIL